MTTRFDGFDFLTGPQIALAYSMVSKRLRESPRGDVMTEIDLVQRMLWLEDLADHLGVDLHAELDKIA